MKRRWWFLALFAPQVAGQEPGDGPGMAEWRKKHPGPGWGVGACDKALNRCKPDNNECPVCGTMAKPYLREDEVLKFKSQGLIFTVEEVRKQNLTRCAHCSAAFWQDAQPEGVSR